MTGVRFDDPGRANAITPLRILLATLVLIPHAFITGTTAAIAPEWEAFINRFADGAVNGFFVLSGFLIAKSLAYRGPTASYFVSRMLRIFPGLIALTLVAVFLIGPLVSTVSLSAYFASADTWLFIPRVALFVDANAALPGVFEEARRPAVAEATWTLRHEFIAYVVGAIGFALGVWRGKAWTALAVIGAALAYIALRSPVLIDRAPEDLVQLSRFLVCFTLGGAAFWWRDRITLRWSTLGLLTALGLISWIVAPNAPLLANLPLAYGLLMAAYGAPKPIARWDPPDVSYGVYIWHVPLMKLALTVDPTLHPLVLLVGGLPLALAAGWASWIWVEKPALALKSRALARLGSGARTRPST